MLCFALINLAKLSWPERDDTGEANVVGVEVLKWVIRILKLYKTSEAVSYRCQESEYNFEAKS